MQVSTVDLRHSSSRVCQEMEPELVVEYGLLKSIGGFTWPGIEYGHPPGYKYSFFQYIDALRFGDLEVFKEIEEESGDWWFPTLDRGAGAALHFAAEDGQLACVKFLVEQRKVEVNQRDLRKGWTPLLRCANMAHHTHAPYLEIFEYLLQQGADASLLSDPDPQTGRQLSAVDIAVQQGRGWEPGEVRRCLQVFIDKYKDVPKKPVYTYEGGHIEKIWLCEADNTAVPFAGETAARILRVWEKSEPIVPPSNWVPPPPAGYMDAQGMRHVEEEPWRPAGEDDGSYFTRPMTEAELREQAAAAEAAAAH